MSDTIPPVSSDPAASPADAAATDETALAEQFATALLQAGIFMMSSLQSDASDAALDSSSEPDAPF